MSQFTSFDGIAIGENQSTLQRKPTQMARRSVSIFSRKGTETPEPKPAFISQEAVRSSRRMTDKQKSWIRRRSSISGSSPSSPKSPKGTILNAVPPAKTIKMTALEEEMATSPNEEILFAIGGQSPTHSTKSASEFQLPPHPAVSPTFWNKSPRSEKRHSTNTRIGLWVNGVTHWENPEQDRNQFNYAGVEDKTGFTPLRSITYIEPPGENREKPNLTVRIPDHQRNIVDESVIMHPTPLRPSRPVTPAKMITDYSRTPVATPPREASPAKTATPPPAIPTRRRPVSICLDSIPLSPEITPQTTPCKTARSYSTDSSTVEQDDSSVYSKHSSQTSLDPHESSDRRDSGIADESDVNVNKPLPPNPIPVPDRAAPTPPSALDNHILRQTASMRDTRRSLPIFRPLKSSASAAQLDLIDRDFIRSSPYVSEQVNAEPTSPTLSQAENDLHTQLSAITPVMEKDNEMLQRSGSVRSVMQPSIKAPTVPKRSRKREWRRTVQANHIANMIKTEQLRRRRSESNMQNDAIEQEVTELHRSASTAGARRSKAFSELMHMASIGHQVQPQQFVFDDGLVVVQGPVIIRNTIPMPSAAASAEDVLLNILATLDSNEDLFNTAMINKGMYRVFKENEMYLLREVVYNQSPAAWELREWCPPDRNEVDSSKASSQLEHDPKTYTFCQSRDEEVIEQLKALVLMNCNGFIRADTAAALAHASHPCAQRVNDAFWRIWCFSKIFGCNKGREDDVTGQLDWLKGGILANNQGCAATVNTNLDFDMSSILLNAPDHFARGNKDGLDAHQLYDMIELWTCLYSLLQGYHGRTQQARQAGVFANCRVLEGEIEKEELMLEEWTYYLLSLGPSVVLEMATFAIDSDSSMGFELAQQNEWTRWNPPQYNGTRSTFLKEPVARLYEERVNAAAHALLNPLKREMKEMSRKRVATLAAEIKLRRQSSTYNNNRYAPDRGMSMPSLSRQPSNMCLSVASDDFDALSIVSTPRCMSPAPQQPGSPRWSPRKISPIIEDRVETFNRMAKFNGVAEDTSDRAVHAIVAMGFTPAEAKRALRKTDMGDGLRIDRAVDMLMRQS